MDLSVITVTWNSAELIREQIKSVKAGCKNVSFEQFVVDSASADNTAGIIEKETPWVKLIKSNTNLGFAGGNNLGAKKAQGEFLLFLNPDMRVEEGSLDKMVEWMRGHTDVGVASCTLLDEQGDLNKDALPRRFPTVWDQLAIILKLPHLFPKVLDHYLFKDFNPELEQEVDSVRGSFMIMRRQVYEKLGWAFDPRYFIWFDDVDTCREVKKMGLKVMYTPIISCVDYVGQSFKKRSTLWKQKQYIKSMVQYFWKWESVRILTLSIFVASFILTLALFIDKSYFILQIVSSSITLLTSCFLLKETKDISIKLLIILAGGLAVLLAINGYINRPSAFLIESRDVEKWNSGGFWEQNIKLKHVGQKTLVPYLTIYVSSTDLVLSITPRYISDPSQIECSRVSGGNVRTPPPSPYTEEIRCDNLKPLPLNINFMYRGVLKYNFDPPLK